MSIASLKNELLATRAELEHARRLLRGVVDADKQDAMMGHPNPGDSCISTYIALVLMEYLDNSGGRDMPGGINAPSPVRPSVRAGQVFEP